MNLHRQAMDALRSPLGPGHKPSRRSSLTQQTGLLHKTGGAQRVARRSSAAGDGLLGSAVVPSRVQVCSGI